MRDRPLKNLKEPVFRLVASLPQGARIREQMALSYWDSVLGPQASAAAQPEAVRDGVVYVRTKSSVWSQEIMLLRGKILAELNRRIGRKALKEMRCHVSATPVRPEWSWVPYVPNREEVMAVQLSAEEEEALERGLAAVRGAAEGDLAERLVRSLCYRHKLRAWRMRQGWSECALCGCAYRGGDPRMCGYCAAVGSL